LRFLSRAPFILNHPSQDKPVVAKRKSQLVGEITNFKHQIPNKSQIPNPKDININYIDFSSIDENVLSSISYAGLLFEILVIGICLLFEICYLEFRLS